jgi:chaperonin cofactor prefoldin
MVAKTATQKVSDVLARLEKHEAECAVRYEMINKQLDNGEKRFDKLEALIISMYPFILVTIAIAEYLR